MENIMNKQKTINQKSKSSLASRFKKAMSQKFLTQINIFKQQPKNKLR